MNRIRIILFCSALSSSTYTGIIHAETEEVVTPVTITAAPEHNKQLQTAAPTVTEQEQIAGLSEDTQKIRLIITAVVQKFETHTTLSGEEKKNVRLMILNMQQFLQNVQNIPDDSAANCNVKNKIHEHIITILQQMVASQGKEFPAFAPELIIKKCFNQEISMTQLINDIERNHNALIVLEQHVRNLGLTRMNRFARGLEQQGRRFHALFKWVAVIGGIGWLVHRILKPKAAEPIVEVPQTPEQVKINEFVTNVSAGALGHAGIQMSRLILDNSRELFTEKWNAVKHGAHTFWNKLKGQESVLDVSGYKIVDSKMTFSSDELVGLEEQIQQVSPILECALDLEGFISRGNKPQYGTLLVGPSGCGKTQFARALSGTIRQIFDAAGKSTQVSFREINCWEFRFNTLRNFIAEARKQGGVVVLFIDEIHNLNMQTTRDTSALNEFLTQMSDLYTSEDPNSHVFLIAATNEPRLLGTSLLVPGRFGKIIHFNYPNPAKRTQFFTTFLPKAGVNPDEVDIDSLVRQTNQFVSFSKLRQIINEARIKASSKNEILGQQHLQAAVDTIVHRFTHTNELTAQEQHLVAVHQAGKALAHHLFALNKIVERVTIGGVNQEVKEINEFNGLAHKNNPNKDPQYKPTYGTIITYDMSEAISLDSKEEQAKQAKMLLAGIAAQELLLGTHSNSYQQEDMQEALQLAQKIILNGKTMQELSKKRQEEIKDAAEALLEQFRRETEAVLAVNKTALEAIVAALKDKVTLSGSEIKTLIA